VKRNRKWQASIMVNHRSFYLGEFSTQLQAALAYDDGALRLLGIERATLNFPERKRSENIHGS
jgi:hypothetical protein